MENQQRPIALLRSPEIAKLTEEQVKLATSIKHEIDVVRLVDKDDIDEVTNDIVANVRKLQRVTHALHKAKAKVMP